MDATDVRLLRAMFPRAIGGGAAAPGDLRAPALARAVGLSVNAAKARLARLTETSVLQGFACFPPLAVLGLRGGGFLVRALERRARDDVVAQLDARQRLLRVYDYAGGHLCVELAWGDPRERDELLAIIRDAAGGESPDLWLTMDSAAQECPPLTPLDWRVLAALRRDPLRHPAEVADALGISARTVKRRVERLVGHGALWPLPKLDCSRASGVLLVELLFTLGADADAAGRAAILRAFERERVWAFEPASHAVGHFDLLLVAESTGEVERLRARGEALAPVTRVEALYCAGSEDHGGWLERLVEERAAAATAGAPAAAALPTPTPEPARLVRPNLL